MWGIRVYHFLVHLIHRFTPTRVGNTLANVVAPDFHSGSPPRVWGIRTRRMCMGRRERFTPTRVGNTLGVGAGQERDCRFTPTRVGNTPPTSARCSAYAVHPHACGEYSRLMSSAPAQSGSPPRVWGIRAHLITSPRALFGSPPRVWGIHPPARCLPPRHRGSPPRVWGIRPRRHIPEYGRTVHPHACGEYCWNSRHEGRGGRFTPTRVGNTV